jgi:hypothetical protein
MLARQYYFIFDYKVMKKLFDVRNFHYLTEKNADICTNIMVECLID